MRPSPLESTIALLAGLSYTEDSGWLPKEKFTAAKTHRFALEQASVVMHVIGAFCWMDMVDTHRVAPLVYVAEAQDKSASKEIHRKVWSQGLVPFLLVLTPEEVIVCDGFTFNRNEWDQQVTTIPLATLNLAAVGQPGAPLRYLHSAQLRSSLTWRDHSLEVSGRVDRKLLDGLAGLSEHLTKPVSAVSALPYTAANGLIGKMLYVFFLCDRGIVGKSWFESRGHKTWREAIAWKKVELGKILSDLDKVFNGSIFPITARDWKLIKDEHIELVTQVLKRGAVAHSSGGVQLSFIDVDLEVLRVETLSAIYEQFLANAGHDERSRSGAYYTPPFLVDLVLDRIEEWQPFSGETTVLDPACGSGVFLVGAYRRILESQRGSGALPLEQVRSLLTTCIFGFERNLDACHVTAFSLYLTMLDYVMPRDLDAVAEGRAPKKLFPPLVGENIYPQDFFDKRNKQLHVNAKCIIGNPPWQNLTKLESPHAETWATRNPDAPCGDDQVAELFTWKALQEHLTEGGVLGLLLPAKSFVNPSSRPLRTRLAQEHSVLGVINFAHMRYKLFGGARHACAALFVRRSEPAVSSATWFYSPLSVAQPIKGKQYPWTLTFDRSELTQVRQLELSADSRAWFELTMLRPVDRHIHGFVRDQIASSRIYRLNDLCEKINASLSRGGSSDDSGIAAQFIDDAHSPWTAASQEAGADKEIQYELFANFLKHAQLPVDDRLPLNQLAVAKGKYKRRFAGNLVLIPRNFRGIRFIDYPKAFNSSFLALYLEGPDPHLSPAEKRLLLALAKYLQSRVARYFLVTGARRWLMDRANVEPEDLKNLPIPFEGPADSRVAQVLAAREEELEPLLMDFFGLPVRLRDAIDEFLDFRIEFRDGNVPVDALNVPSAAILGRYQRSLAAALNELIGRSHAFSVSHLQDKHLGVAIVGTRYFQPEETQLNDGGKLEDLCGKALARYAACGSNSFTTSLAVEVDSPNYVLAIKPLERFRWTVESAYSDSRRILAELTGRM